MDIQEFIDTRHLTMQIRPAARNPNMVDQKWEARHWHIAIKRGQLSFNTYFSQGMGITHSPTCADVLDCVASESTSYESASSFQSWADEMGYDTDSALGLRTAKRTYDAIEKSAVALREFLGQADYDILLYQTERL